MAKGYVSVSVDVDVDIDDVLGEMSDEDLMAACASRKIATPGPDWVVRLPDAAEIRRLLETGRDSECLAILRRAVAEPLSAGALQEYAAWKATQKRA